MLIKVHQKLQMCWYVEKVLTQSTHTLCYSQYVHSRKGCSVYKRFKTVNNEY